MTPTTRPVSERINECETKAANCLATARRLEHSDPERAEVWFDRSAKWMMKSNALGYQKNGYDE